MKLRSPILIRTAGLLGAAAVRTWMSTVRWRIWNGARPVFPNFESVRERFLYGFWHESLLALGALGSAAPVHVMVSQHADGELITRIIQHLGLRVVRGSSTRGAVEAVRGMLRKAARSHLGVTPDGPRGPRRQVQPGLIFLASKTGLPIAPLGVGFCNAWRANSWDRFAIPKLFSTITGVAGRVVHVPAKLNRKQLEGYRRLVEDEMLAATAAAEAWAAAGAKGRPPADRAWGTDLELLSGGGSPRSDDGSPSAEIGGAGDTMRLRQAG